MENFNDVLLANKQVPASFTKKRCAVKDYFQSGCGNPGDQTWWRWYPRCWLGRSCVPLHHLVPLSRSPFIPHREICGVTMCSLPEFCWAWAETHFKLASWRVFYLWSHPSCCIHAQKANGGEGVGRVKPDLKEGCSQLWAGQGVPKANKWLHLGGPPEIAPARGQSARHWLEQRPCHQPAIQTRVLFRCRVGEPAVDGSRVFWEASRCCVPGTLRSVIQ